MATASNLDEVIRWLESFVNGFDFLLPGKDKNLGRDLAREGAGYLADRSTQNRGADSPWQPNREPYRTTKEKHYGWADNPNRRTGQMLSETSLFGGTEVMAKRIEMKYGTGQPPSGTASPIDQRTNSERSADQSITDIEKAYFAHHSGNRPFYEADDDMEVAVIAVAQDALVDYILKFG